MRKLSKSLSIVALFIILSFLAISHALAVTTISVKNGNAALLSTPSSKGKIVYKVIKYTTLTVVGTKGNYYKVTYNKKTLWVSKSVVYATNYEKDGDIVLATTTSTQDSGFLDKFIPAFTRRTGIKVKVIAVGTGAAIKMGQQGDADVLLVHDRAKEDQFMKDGYGSARRSVMHNDFLIVGPSNDPAHIKGYKDPVAALKKIAASKATFISRGDKSGTNSKELALWKSAKITPSGSWYVSAGQGMGETLNMAKEMGGYTLTDIATYLQTKKNHHLVTYVRGAKTLYNPYGVITVNKKKFPSVHKKSADSFLKYITSSEGQLFIKKYRISPFTEPVFYPDALPNIK